MFDMYYIEDVRLALYKVETPISSPVWWVWANTPDEALWLVIVSETEAGNDIVKDYWNVEGWPDVFLLGEEELKRCTVYDEVKDKRLSLAEIFSALAMTTAKPQVIGCSE